MINKRNRLCLGNSKGCVKNKLQKRISFYTRLAGLRRSVTALQMSHLNKRHCLKCFSKKYNLWDRRRRCEICFRLQYTSDEVVALRYPFLSEERFYVFLEYQGDYMLLFFHFWYGLNRLRFKTLKVRPLKFIKPAWYIKFFPYPWELEGWTYVILIILFGLRMVSKIHP